VLLKRGRQTMSFPSGSLKIGPGAIGTSQLDGNTDSDSRSQSYPDRELPRTKEVQPCIGWPVLGYLSLCWQ